MSGINGRLTADMLAPIPWAPSKLVANEILYYVVQMGRAYQSIFGVYPTINDAYRTYDRQLDLFRERGYPDAAYPGTSNHGTGRALDVAVGSYGSMRWHFMNETARMFGFRPLNEGNLRFEPWHWQNFYSHTYDWDEMATPEQIASVVKAAAPMLVKFFTLDGATYEADIAGNTYVWVPDEDTLRRRKALLTRCGIKWEDHGEVVNIKAFGAQTGPVRFV
jgi:hypothetical protein